jgi:YD repeat-containing protein
MPRIHIKCAVLAVSIFPVLCRAQLPDVSPLDGYTAGQTQQGGPAGSYALSGLETLNTANGTLSLHIPVATVQARGSVSVPLIVQLTPPIWDVTANAYEYNCIPGGCQLGWLYTMTSSGWLGDGGFGVGQLVFRSSGDYCVVGASNTNQWHNVLTRGTFSAPDGTETEFVDQQTNGTPEPGNLGYNRGTAFIADNGSMAKFTSSASISDSTYCNSAQTTYPSGTLVFRDGTKYTITGGAVTKIEDHNGNYTSFGNPITDSLGRTYTISSGSSSETLQYYGAGGGSRTITVHYSSLSGVLAAGQSLETYGQLWSLPSGLQNASQQYDPNGMVSEIDLPDGSKYSFTYTSYADVAQITLPTGGVIQYDYTNAVSDGTTAFGTVDVIIGGQPVATQVPPAYMYALARPLKERRQYLNGNYIGKTDFPSTSEIDSYDGSGNLLAKETQTIASAGTLPSAGVNYNPAQYNQRTTANYYDAGGSTLLESQTMAYYQPSNCKTNCPTVETVTTTMNSWVKQTSYAYDQYNNVSSETDYDWGNGSLAAPCELQAALTILPPALSTTTSWDYPRK